MCSRSWVQIRVGAWLMGSRFWVPPRAVWRKMKHEETWRNMKKHEETWRNFCTCVISSLYPACSSMPHAGYTCRVILWDAQPRSDHGRVICGMCYIQERLVKLMWPVVGCHSLPTARRSGLSRRPPGWRYIWSIFAKISSYVAALTIIHTWCDAHFFFHTTLW